MNEKHIEFQIASNDYFGTLATTLDLLRQAIDERGYRREDAELLRILRDALLYLQAWRFPPPVSQVPDPRPHHIREIESPRRTNPHTALTPPAWNLGASRTTTFTLDRTRASREAFQ